MQVVAAPSVSPQQRKEGRVARPQELGGVHIAGRYASVFDRFAAQVIDWIILIFLSAIVSVLVGLSALFANPFGLLFTFSWYGAFAGIMGALIPLLYFSYFESTSGQTIGKRVVSIKVVDQANGTRIDFGRSLIRNVLRIVDFLPLFYIIGAILVASTSRKQRIGDFAANSVVVKV